ncbi:glycosyltransferase family 4 protein [Terriglobus sp.]|uniref:glycosyltransferase family 4 protein n=1 Tax=Terriglobus sp. TaxID=1889013 RepID=UPI003AFF86D2
MIIAGLVFSSFLACLVLTPVIRNLFLRFGLVDLPDDIRKLHARPTPRSGGIAIVLACAVSLGCGYLLLPAGAVIYIQHRVLLTAVLPATLLMFAVGVADDLADLRPRFKLLGQCAAAVCAVLLGAHLTLPHAPVWLSAIISVVWLLACTNAVNLIDGMDGLASGVSLLAAVTTLAVAVLHHNFGLMLATAPLVGALFGFLRYNFAPASVFLGDAGSLTIGFVLGCLGMVWTSHSDGLGLLGPLLALALPLIDVTLAISRRYLRRVPIFKADRGHIHHRVLALGFSTKHATLILYGCCLIFAALALLQSFGKREYDIVVVVFFIIFILLGVRRLEYVEFRAVRHVLRNGALRNIVADEINVQELQHELLAASTAEGCWKALSRVCEDPHISQVTLHIAGLEFKYRNALLNGVPTYSVHLPIGEDNSLTLSGSIHNTPRSMTTRLYQLHAALTEKVLSLETGPHIVKKAA